MLFFVPSKISQGGKNFVRLSTSARYSLRALSDLCTYPEEPVSVSDIATRQNIPAAYLEQLFGKLRRAGILESVRGSQGGYILARPERDITVAEILQAIGEPLIFGSCQTEKGCENAVKCPTFNLWRKVKGSVDEILRSTTLEDIAGETLTLLDAQPDPERIEARRKAQKSKGE
ncbi:MAG: Rrf2 family transcriptional regulator [Synergistaceae bacterium]|nr:Rrf2 family transcriptional regulator [Synergistaceae bacterium]